MDQPVRRIDIYLSEDDTPVGWAELGEGRVVFGGAWGDGPDRRWVRARGSAHVLWPEDGSLYLEALADELRLSAVYRVELRS